MLNSTDTFSRAPSPSALAPCGLSSIRCSSGRRHGGHSYDDTRYAQPRHPPSALAPCAAVGHACSLSWSPRRVPEGSPEFWRSLLDDSALNTRCLSGSRATAPQHRHAQPRPSSLRAGAVRRCPRRGLPERAAGWLIPDALLSCLTTIGMPARHLRPRRAAGRKGRGEAAEHGLA